MTTQLQAGDRVCSGTGDDYDEGIIDRIDGDQAVVRWNSLVVTTQPLDMLRRLDD